MKNNKKVTIGFLFLVLTPLYFLSSSSFSATDYVSKKICQFNSKDVLPDFSNPFFRFDVDGNGNIFFLDQTNEIKVFNFKGELVKKINWPRNLNKFWEFLARGNYLFIYSGYDAYAMNLKDGVWKKLTSQVYLREITLFDGEVYDFMNGKILFSLDGDSKPVPIPYFFEKHVIDDLYVISTSDKKHKTMGDYDGYRLMGIESVDQEGNIYAIYGKPNEEVGPNGNVFVGYSLELYEFDEGLKIEKVWNDFHLRVNESLGCVYELENQNDVWRLVRWSKSK